MAKKMDLTMEEIYEIFIKPGVRDWKPSDLCDFEGDETGGDEDENLE